MAATICWTSTTCQTWYLHFPFWELHCNQGIIFTIEERRTVTQRILVMLKFTIKHLNQVLNFCSFLVRCISLPSFNVTKSLISEIDNHFLWSSLEFPQHPGLISVSIHDMLQVNSHIFLYMLGRKANFCFYFPLTIY